MMVISIVVHRLYQLIMLLPLRIVSEGKCKPNEYAYPGWNYII